MMLGSKKRLIKKEGGSDAQLQFDEFASIAIAKRRNFCSS